MERWSGQLLRTRSGANATARSCFRREQLACSIRHQSTTASPDIIFEDGAEVDAQTDSYQSRTNALPRPSPLPDRALSSAKLAALHARLSLSDKIPLQTLARTLVDASADQNPSFNNTNLAFLGMTLINYHVAEWLMCRYPRLPMTILYSAMNGFAGSRSLHKVAQSWGVESAAAPGEEVDPGLLQFSLDADKVQMKKWGYVRPEAQHTGGEKWRRGIASRVVMDDDFGDQVTRAMARNPSLGSEDELPEERRLTLGNSDEKMQIAFDAHASFVRSVIGAIYGHCGREAAKSFVRAHILSRHLDISNLFWFEKPTGELAKLCAREEFEKPVARLLSETGRLSRTPVFVVGIFSGQDKLGEGAASSLEAARTKAAINALKAWYLYSPGENVRVPSDMLVEGAKSWEPVHVDIGEII